jgi:carbon-monoxide dehydrogenase large subunit
MPVENPVASDSAHGAAMRFGSGRAVPRVEDEALLRGQGRFVDNVTLDGAPKRDDAATVAREAFVAFQRSPYAHARILGIDADAARAMPGVLAVYTGA